MPGFIPALDNESLTALRRLVQSMHQENGKAMPLTDLIELSKQVKTDNGITIDFRASESLGSPMVVVQVPQQCGDTPFFRELSKREQDVASLIARGLSNKQIAKKLHIALPTVKDHVHRILVKAELPNRTAIAVAMRS
ncbi:MAG: response regulator transcription factor [Planctomycetia bacterium]|jgi:DNA-binding NarL/FixJ family response regulator|nr:response regulator transcription factor [Planctomycetia bacterium]